MEIFITLTCVSFSVAITLMCLAAIVYGIVDAVRFVSSGDMDWWMYPVILFVLWFLILLGALPWVAMISEGMIL